MFHAEVQMLTQYNIDIVYDYDTRIGPLHPSPLGRDQIQNQIPLRYYLDTIKMTKQILLDT